MGEHAEGGRARARSPRRGPDLAALTRRLPIVVLAVAVVGGAIVRVLGISWGLPLTLHPDEWVIVEGAIDMAERNSFEPSHFQRPDHVEIKLSYLAYVAYTLVVHRTPVETAYAMDPAAFTLISRGITVAFGMVAVLLAYLIGRRFGRAVGAMSALVFAFFPSYVHNSYFATPDVPLIAAVLMTVLACLWYLDKPSLRSLLIASASVAVAIAIKYPGALGSLLIAATVVAAAARDRAWLRIVTHGLTAIAGVLVALFLISPVLFTNLTGVIDAITAETTSEHLGADGLSMLGKLAFYTGDFIGDAGYLLVVFALAGLVWAVRQRRLDLLPLLVGIVYLLALSALPLHWDRWGLPMYVTPLLLAPIGVHWLYRAARQHAPQWGPVAVLGLFAISSLHLAAGAAATAVRYMAKDTRQAALAEIDDLGASADNTIFEGYTPFRPGAPWAIFSSFEVEDGQVRVSPDYPEVDQQRFVMISSQMYNRYRREARYVAEQEFYDLLAEQFPRVRRWSATDGARTSSFEPIGIWNHLGYVLGPARGGLSGPTLVLYEIPPEALPGGDGSNP